MASGSPPVLLSQFEDALEAFTQTLSHSEKADFQFAEVADVHREIGRIQKEQERKHLLRGLKRITPFVDGLVRYSAVIEQFVTINPGILAAIWGPLKLILQVSNNAKKSFDIIISALAKIGHCLPRFAMFADIFKQSPRFSQVLVWLYTDILEFYSEVLKFFRKNPTEQFFSALWSKFNDHFEYLLGRFENHAALVDAEANAADLKEAYSFRVAARKEFQEAAKEREKLMLEEATTWLAPLSFDDELQRCQDLVDNFSNSGKWLLDDSKFSAWLTGAAKSVLWLSGIPGSGKTTLSYIAWSYLVKENTTTDTATFAFFLSDRSRAIHSAVSVLQTLAYQLLISDMALLSLFDELRESFWRRQDARTRKSIEQLVERLISASSLKRIRVVVDGIDEIDGQERVALMNFLLQLSGTHTMSFDLLVSGREEWDIKGKLSSYPKIIVNENNGKDIETYVEACQKDLILHFHPHLCLEEVTAMLKPLPLRSDGMFLFARLVIFNLKQQTNLAQLREAVEDLPKGLDQAYSRIIQRLNIQEQNRRQIALSILQYLLCARRPPRLIEITYALTVQVGRTSFDRNRLLINELDELCGPILEIRKETVSFVHFSAKEYLQLYESGLHLELSMGHFAMASRCLAYLLFDCFWENLNNNAIIKYLEQGEYLWLDYVQCYWLEHLRAAIRESSDNARKLETLVCAVVHRWRRITGLKSDMRNNHISFEFDCFKERCPNEYRTLCQAAIYKSQYKSLDTSQDPFLLFEFCKNTWQHLEAAMQPRASRTETEVILRKFYGFNLFRCSKPGCQRLSNPFPTAPERDKHMRCHNRPFKCHDSTCEYFQLGFSSASALSKHEKVHVVFEPAIDALTSLSLTNQSAQTPNIPQTQTSWNFISDAVVSDNIELVKNIIRDIIADSGRYSIDSSWPTRIYTSKDLYTVEYSDSYNVLICQEPKNPLLSMAARSGSISTLRWLLEEGFGSYIELLNKEPTLVWSESMCMRHEDYVSKALGDILESAVSTIFTRNTVATIVEREIEAVQLMLQHGAQAAHSTLDFAIKLECMELVQLLLTHADDDWLVHGLITAVGVSDDMTCILLDYGTPVDGTVHSANETALCHAVQKQRLTTVKLLLDRGADPRKNDNRVMQLACELPMKNAEAVLFIDMLAEAGADVNCAHGFPLRHVAIYGRSETLKMLLDKGADPNLHRALKAALSRNRKPNAQCAKLLLEFGADPNAKRRGKLPKDYALTRKFPEYFGVTWDEVVEANKHKVPLKRQNSSGLQKNDDIVLADRPGFGQQPPQRS